MSFSISLLIGAGLAIALLYAEVSSRRWAAIRSSQVASSSLWAATTDTLAQAVARSRLAQVKLEEAGLYEEADRLREFTVKSKSRVYADRDWAQRKLGDLARQFRSECG